MAIYHLSAKIISRSEGKSATAACAYRSASKIRDHQTGEIHDYTRKGHVDHCEILAPENAPSWVMDRESLWNAVEAAEIRKDAQVCREIELAIPVELPDDQKKALVIEFVQQTFVDAGMVADIAFHKLDSGNPHAHVLLTTRTIGPDGFGGKNRDWNQKPLLESWRKSWEVSANQSLESAGSEARIDHRSLKDQGIDRDPTTHLGPEATEYERRTGEKSEKRKRHESKFDQVKEVSQSKPENYYSIEAIRRRQAERDAERAKNPNLYDWRDRLDSRRSAWGRSYLEAVAPDYSKPRPERGKIRPVVYRWKEGKAKGYAAVLDYGDRLKPAGRPESISDAKIEVMLDLAVAKGWQGVAIFGHRDFRDRVAEIAERRGIPLLDDDLRQARQMQRDIEDRERRFKEMNERLRIEDEKRLADARKAVERAEAEKKAKEKIEAGMAAFEAKATAWEKANEVNEKWSGYSQEKSVSEDRNVTDPLRKSLNGFYQCPSITRKEGDLIAVLIDTDGLKLEVKLTEREAKIIEESRKEFRKFTDAQEWKKGGMEQVRSCFFVNIGQANKDGGGDDGGIEIDCSINRDIIKRVQSHILDLGHEI